MVINTPKDLPVCQSCKTEIQFQRWMVRKTDDGKIDETRVFVCNNDECELKGKHITLPILSEEEHLAIRSENYLDI